MGLRKSEGVLHRLEGLLRAVAVKDRDAGVFAEVPCILFRLGRDRAWIIGHIDDQAALDTDVIHTHHRIRCHVESHLLHGDHGSGAAVGCARRHLRAGFLIDGPFHMNAAGIAFGDGLQNLGRGRPRIPGHHLHAGSQGADGNGFISHQ